MSRQIQLGDEHFTLIRMIDPEWIKQYGQDTVQKHYNTDCIVVDEIGRLWVSRMTQDAQFTDIEGVLNDNVEKEEHAEVVEVNGWGEEGEGRETEDPKVDDSGRGGRAEDSAGSGGEASPTEMHGEV